MNKDMRKISIRFFLIIIIGSGLLSCKNEELKFKNKKGTSVSSSWDFSNSSDYTFDSNYIDVSNGSASLKTVDQTHSGTDFNSGTHVGTYVDSNDIVTIDFPSLQQYELSSGWTPKYSMISAYWKLNGTVGTITPGLGQIPDFGPNSLSLNTVDGSSDSLAFTQGYIEQSVYFDGVDDVLVSNSHSQINTTHFSVAIWAKPTGGSGTYRAVISNLYHVGPPGEIEGYRVYINTSDNWVALLEDTVDSSDQKIISSEKALLDKWTHLVITYNGTQMKLFIDGELIGSRDFTNYLPNRGNSFKIGAASNSGTVWPFPGEIDEVAIWVTPLSDSEVIEIYNKQKLKFSGELSPLWTPKWDNIVGYWKMDGNWQDSSGNENHGTPKGNADFSTSSKIGSSAASFAISGKTDHVYVEDSTEFHSTSFSLATWVNQTELGHADYSEWVYIISRSDNTGSGSGQHFGLSQGPASGGHPLSLRIGKGASGEVYCNDYSINLYQLGWKHVAFTVDYHSGSDTMDVIIYIDGKPSKTCLSLSGQPNASVTGDLVFGGWSAHSDPNNISHSWGNFNGQIDEIAFWDTNLSAKDIKSLYNRQKQKYAGHYESPVIDLGTSGAWTNLDAITSLPFGKEIVAQTSESSSDYSSLSGDLSSGLVGYWPFNELLANSVSGDDTEDMSGSGFHGTETGSLSYDTQGIFKSGIGFDGSSYISHGDVLDFPSNQPFSFSVWFKQSYQDVSFRRIFEKGETDGDGKQGYKLLVVNSSIKFEMWRDGTSTQLFYNDLSLNVYTHIFGSFDGTTVKLYIDGKLIDSGVGKSLKDNIGNFSIGSASSGGSLVKGVLDEIAFWSRGFSATEIQQLYRRGANRIKYQVKSCVDSSCNCKSFNTSPVGSATDCDGDGILNSSDTSDIYMADWIGKDGATGETFSELQNCSSIDGSGNCSGSTKATSPSFNFTDFPTAAQPTNNRYFQYRVLFEAEDNTACGGSACMPELTSVEIGPTGRYYGGTPLIRSNTPISYSALKSMTFSEGGACTPEYQLSPDGSTYYYWDGSAWTAASGETISQSSSSSEVSNNITSFSSSGSLYFKALLNSDTSQSCEISNVGVTKQN